MTAPGTVTLFEGPDGSGKSTLIRELAAREDSHAIITHHGPYPGAANIARRYLSDLAADTGTAYVDRCWVSEPIYGRVMRDGSRIDRVEARHLSRVSTSRDAVIVICLPPLERVLDSYRCRRDSEYVDSVNSILFVYENYARIADLEYLDGVPIVVYDYTRDDHNPKNLRDEIAAMRELKPIDAPGGGAWKNDVTLIVGDRPGADDQTYRRHGDPGGVPFASLGNRGCSRWLTELLELNSIHEEDLYWVNATDHTGEMVTDPEFIDALSPRRVIALGINAAAWCYNIARVSHSVVPHPQYWRCFRFGESDGYPLIEELVK